VAIVVAQVGDAARERLIDDVSVALRSYIDDDGLTLPIQGHLAVARAQLDTVTLGPKV
jgi:hypothetical protein